MLELRILVREVRVSRDGSLCFVSDVNKTVRYRLFDLGQRPRAFRSKKRELLARAAETSFDSCEFSDDAVRNPLPRGECGVWLDARRGWL